MEMFTVDESFRIIYYTIYLHGCSRENVVRVCVSILNSRFVYYVIYYFIFVTSDNHMPPSQPSEYYIRRECKLSSLAVMIIRSTAVWHEITVDAYVSFRRVFSKRASTRDVLKRCTIVTRSVHKNINIIKK